MTLDDHHSMGDFLLKIKSFIDYFTSVGDPISLQEHIDVILLRAVSRL